MAPYIKLEAEPVVNDLDNNEKEMSLEELDNIVGGTSIIGNKDNENLSGGAGDDVMWGQAGDDTLEGLAGDDSMSGGDGADTLRGGAGDDVLDGGVGDNANDVAHGGAGDDAFIWGLSGDGSDTFHGGEGDDKLQLDLGWGTNTIQDAYNNGDWTIELKDAEDNDIEITDNMWDENGNLILPDGATGVITGTNSETLTFDGVQRITTFDLFGTDIKGHGGNDNLTGESDHFLHGEISAATIEGGGGDDIMHGGEGDGADDSAYGGSGDDTYVWGLSGDGNDTFHGGSGNDALALDLDSVDANTIQEAYDNGDWTIELTDAEGNEIPVTDDMWDEYGNLNLSDGATGVITGTGGETMTFDGVESITTSGETPAV
jgi:hypothetical protein